MQANRVIYFTSKELRHAARWEGRGNKKDFEDQDCLKVILGEHNNHGSESKGDEEKEKKRNKERYNTLGAPRSSQPGRAEEWEQEECKV